MMALSLLASRDVGLAISASVADPSVSRFKIGGYWSAFLWCQTADIGYCLGHEWVFLLKH